MEKKKENLLVSLRLQKGKINKSYRTGNSITS